MEKNQFIDVLKLFGVGHRLLDDPLFKNDKPFPRFGIFDLDDENFCHEINTVLCHVPGCQFTAETLLEFENHYNGCHRYSCSLCKKVMPSPHLLDLHIQETHDSFFAILSTKKPSYCCYNEECKEKFVTANERLEHCIKIHKLPKDFRFSQSLKYKKHNTKNFKDKKETIKMDLENADKFESIEIDNPPEHKIIFKNSKQKTFSKYTGKKFTNDSTGSRNINLDETMSNLKEHLPS